MEDLGKAEGTDAHALAGMGASWLSGRGFEVRTRVEDRTVVLQARRSTWIDALSGRSKSIVVRLHQREARWKGDVRLADWTENVPFFRSNAQSPSCSWTCLSLGMDYSFRSPTLFSTMTLRIPFTKPS